VGKVAIADVSSESDVSLKCLCALAGPDEVSLPSSVCGRELVRDVMAVAKVFFENHVTPGKKARGGAMSRTLRTGGALA
jgi:hypothetical protein